MLTKPSILVVDDSIDGRQMLVEYLAFREFPVAEAQNGAEAIEIAHRLQPDVILMDLSMPGVDGWEATRRLKADPLTKSIIIIAVTAHVFSTEQEAARVAGCDAVIPKPYDLTVFADALDRAISEGLSALDPKAVAARASPRQIGSWGMENLAPSIFKRRAPFSTANDTHPSRKRKPAKSR